MTQPAVKSNWKSRIARFDGFPKFGREIAESSHTGGIFSLLVYLLIIYLVYMEFYSYNTPREEFEFVVDGDSSSLLNSIQDRKLDEQLANSQNFERAVSKEELEEERAFHIQVYGNEQKTMESTESSKSRHLWLHLDMLVTMPCDFCAITLVDAAGKVIAVKHNLTLEKVGIDLELSDSESFTIQYKHDVERDDNQGETVGVREVIQNALKQAKKAANAAKSRNSTIARKFESSPQACKISGRLNLNKVSGSLQVTGTGYGLSAASPVRPLMMNFSHHIYKLGFGPDLPRSALQQSLVGAHEIATESNTMYQYFISIVPTSLSDESTGLTVHTNQYSAKVYARPVHEGSSDQHGVSGIFFKFDFEGIRVKVSSRGPRLAEVLVRICSIAGGTFVIIGILLNAYSQFFVKKRAPPPQLDLDGHQRLSPKRGNNDLFVKTSNSLPYSKSLDQISTVDTKGPELLSSDKARLSPEIGSSIAGAPYNTSILGSAAPLLSGSASESDGSTYSGPYRHRNTIYTPVTALPPATSAASECPWNSVSFYSPEAKTSPNPRPSGVNSPPRSDFVPQNN